MKKLSRYILYRWPAGLLCLMLMGVFALSGWLGGLDSQLTYYGLILMTALILLFAVPDFIHFLKRIKELESIKGSLRAIDILPESTDPIENEYQRILSSAYKEVLAEQEDMEQKYNDMMDYYTLWVHQIKTPIAAIRLLLQSGMDGSREELEAELFRIEQYVEMVLSYLRLDSKSTDFVIRRCSIDDMIHQSVKKFAKQFIRKKISLVYEGTDASVLTDEKWMCFVIEQLLANALKYTHTGSITVTADEKHLSVADTGIGIAPENLPRVFEKGYTGYNGRSDKRATGIGLYLCRRILTKLGHGIVAESEVGKGTKITVSFEEDSA